jgi:cytochrome c-type biogenesis protein CcmH/NrfG
LVRRAPDRFEGYHGLGAVKLRRGETAAALDALKRAAELKPQHADVRFLLGRALSQTGAQAGAVEQFRQAIALDGSRTDAHYQLALTLKRLGRDEEAAAEFAIVEKLNAEFRQRTGGMDHRQPSRRR